MSIKTVIILIFSCILMLIKDCSGLSSHDSKTMEDNSQIQYSEIVSLNSNNLTYLQAISPQENDIRQSKFLKIEVVEVYNPKLHPISVDVSHVENDKQGFLGSFSLYPPDNAGYFLIATQGKLSSKGKILISLVLPETIQKTDTMSLTLKKISFL